MSERKTVMLFILLIASLSKVSQGFEIPCNASNSTMKIVQFCPLDEQTYIESAKKKNCPAILNNCKSFEYHCLSNRQKTALIEVCAPSLKIIGKVCGTYHEGFNSIRSTEKPCPNCPFSYNSTEQFRYPVCHELLTSSTAPQNTAPQELSSSPPVSAVTINNETKDKFSPDILIENNKNFTKNGQQPGITINTQSQWKWEYIILASLGLAFLGTILFVLVEKTRKKGNSKSKTDIDANIHLLSNEDEKETQRTGQRSMAISSPGCIEMFDKDQTPNAPVCMDNSVSSQTLLNEQLPSSLMSSNQPTAEAYESVSPLEEGTDKEATPKAVDDFENQPLAKDSIITQETSATEDPDKNQQSEASMVRKPPHKRSIPVEENPVNMDSKKSQIAINIFGNSTDNANFSIFIDQTELDIPFLATISRENINQHPKKEIHGSYTTPGIFSDDADQEQSFFYDSEHMDEKKESKEYLVLTDTNYLPRYKYHRSLLDWFLEGIPNLPTFQQCHFDDSCIIIGGNLNEENKIKLFGETTLTEKVAFADLQKAKATKEYTNVLMVYIFNGDIAAMLTEIIELQHFKKFKNGKNLVVVPKSMLRDELKSKLSEEMAKHGVLHVEFVDGNRPAIISSLTCVLEERISQHLKQIRTKLLTFWSPTSTIKTELLKIWCFNSAIRSSLVEVNAILRRLKQASSYPEPFIENEEERTDKKEINEILQSFGDKILYDEYDEEILYIITTDQSVKKALEAWYSSSDIHDLKLVITVEENLSLTELSKTGVPLHGAKLVYVNESVESFNADKRFATTGSLMFANNNNMMIVITCRHALEQVDTCFTLIDDVVVRIGQEMPQPNNRMERLCDDIAVVAIDADTRSVVDEKCEKLLIDSFGFPSPAQISSRDLKVGDIVHKRGAKTGHTIGIVKRVKNQTVGQFTLPSTVIFIASRDAAAFAMEGDSGSLVFQPSLSPEETGLEVLAMVQGKMVQNSQTRVVCLPFKESCDNLKQNIPDLQNLQFFNS